MTEGLASEQSLSTVNIGVQSSSCQLANKNAQATNEMERFLLVHAVELKLLSFFKQGMMFISHTLFFYKNLFYKNAQAEINQNFKNIVRTYPCLKSVKNVFILLICFCE